MSLGSVARIRIDDRGDSVSRYQKDKGVTKTRSTGKDHIHFRICEEDRLKLNEVSEKSGMPVSVLLRASVSYMLSGLYNDEGYINEDAIDNINELRDGIAPKED